MLGTIPKLVMNNKKENEGLLIFLFNNLILLGWLIVITLLISQYSNKTINYLRK